MPKKATVQDARLILQLFHLRQEREMRKARHWWLDEFWLEVVKTPSEWRGLAGTGRATGCGK
jgi:hypothetical protein